MSIVRPWRGWLAACAAAWLAGCAAPPPSAPEPEPVAPVAAAPEPAATAAVPAARQPALRIRPERRPGEGSGAPALRAPEPEAPVLLASGQASWYADSLHGRRTASGERYDREEFTAAHRSLPFGARLCVRSLVNGRTVIVRVNDRGPFTPGRIIDLSRAAAEELGMLGLGIKSVELWRLGADEEVCPESQEPAAVEGAGLGLDAAAAARALQRPAPSKAAGVPKPRRKRR
ncbi:septal ring lytic transglycosylase RlpA family protein [Alicycliphilus denitrificans]|uniref:septal ring lytic transglycosylase RlpA family protein n=1 Tax=Alicycliphilus denitrificans TaxID=179636 RepID=UPI00384EBCAA